MTEKQLTKVCNRCGRELPVTEFQRNRKRCRECENARKREWCQANPDKVKAQYDRKKDYSAECAKRWRKERKENRWFEHYTKLKKKDVVPRGIPWDLDQEYLESIWTGVCPVYGTPVIDGSKLEGNERPDNLAELDRLLPEKGYVKGNVRWISRKANRLKSNATIEDLEKILAYMKANINDI